MITTSDTLLKNNQFLMIKTQEVTKKIDDRLYEYVHIDSTYSFGQICPYKEREIIRNSKFDERSGVEANSICIYNALLTQL